jgi:putative membrane protein
MEDIMNRFVLFAAAGLSAVALAACGNNMSADNATMSTGTPAAETASSENVAREAQDFIHNAGQASLVEIRTSEMALEKSASPDVKAFAQTMIDQHKAGLDKIKAAAQAGSLMAPAEILDDVHMRRINDLTETDGDADFDADYSALQVDAHKDAIGLFEDYAKDPAATPALKMLVEEMLPTLTAHKEAAEKLRDTVSKAPGTPNPS